MPLEWGTGIGAVAGIAPNVSATFGHIQRITRASLEQQHRELIQITESKYRGRRLEDDGCVAVRLADVTAQLPQHRSYGIGTPQNHAGGGRESSGLQALYFLSDDAVALAGGRFETLVVENPDFALRVRDQTGGLEYAQGYGDSGPARTQHHRQELMAELNVVVIDANRAP